MAEFPALPLWTDAYLGDTTHLTTIEHGAYLLLLIVAWRSKDGLLPDDDKLLARYAKLTSGQWKKIKPILEPFFIIKDGVWMQGRLTDEFNAVRQLSKRQSKKAKARWLKNNDSCDAVASSGQCPSDASPNPNPNPIKDNTKVLSKKPKKIGTRLDEDFSLPDEWGDWAIEQFGWSVTKVIDTSSRFKDYWLAKSGKDATKVDWGATWRNWCRKQQEGF